MDEKRERRQMLLIYVAIGVIVAVITGWFLYQNRMEFWETQARSAFDGKDADYKENPTSYQIKKGIVTSKTKMSVKEARSGGFALSLIEATPADKKAVKKWR